MNNYIYIYYIRYDTLIDRHTDIPHYVYMIILNHYYIFYIKRQHYFTNRLYSKYLLNYEYIEEL